MIRSTGGNSEKAVTQKQIEVIWTVISLLTGIFLTIVGWRITVTEAMEAKIDRINTTYTEIQTRLASIETNIMWIKTRLNY